jgi:hypothetical protein
MNPRAVVSLVMTAAVLDHSLAFIPSTPQSRTATLPSITTGGRGSRSCSTSVRSNFSHRSRRGQLARDAAPTALRMAAEDFNESKYTEAAWSAIAAITKVADFYQASTVEAPFLLDVMLNPSKHNAGEDAEAAKKVVEKTLNKAGVNVKDLRSELESYLSRQARVSDNSQKAMGRNLQKVLETARIGQSVLGVSENLSHKPMDTWHLILTILFRA